MSLTGKTVSFTGELFGMTRKEATAAAQAAGAFVSSTVSKNTNILVAGNNATPAKQQKAAAMGVSVITQPQFLQFANATAAVPAFTPKVKVAKVAVPQFQAPAAVFTQASNQAISLAGRTVVITGTLDNFNRAEAVARAQQAGATVVPNVTGTTDFMICGFDATESKVAKAQANGVPMISEAQFQAAIPRAFAASKAAKQVQVPAMTFEDPAQPTFSAQVCSLAGKTVAITGTLSNFSRASAAAHAQQAGATVTQTISATTDFLVCGENPTAAKVQAAQMKGVSTINEQQFVAAAGSAAAAPQFQAPKAVAAKKVFTPATPVASGAPIALAGKTVVFTGTLNVNRMVAAVMASNAGASVSSALNAKTSYLVCGSNAGPKLAKAQSLGVQVVTEAEFVAACKH